MINSGTINTARAALTRLPTRERPRTAAQALADLRAELLQARERGYTDAEICNQLAQLGIKTSKATLRRALATARSPAIKRKAPPRHSADAMPSPRVAATDQSSDRA